MGPRLGSALSALPAIRILLPAIPVAQRARDAFRDDQEFAADARVLADRGHAARPLHARVPAKAAAISALHVSNLIARSNQKARLMMLGQKLRSRGRRIFSSAALFACRRRGARGDGRNGR